ncbi:DNA-binding transcriptional regulator, MurR/RpiR family, contains HTH and SIS domains [Facklamia miroungae]|uniref:DNA-binding transcriptional regulator, MurR/RpiR family, contains HTH and SIS domains n=2 Tax=Facklamia miroungae TaxID=120956 RepID=A0A1G7UDH4_9LACT|nr:DNA-binding transcriptional regulator, MurR/RpiR family, contains HTH and SIS domains [Facklamia miroungae]
MSSTEQTIADYIIKNKTKIGHQTISEIANNLGVADSTIFQFTKKLGFSGFKEFKIALLIHSNEFSSEDIHENISKDDTEFSIAKKVFKSNISTLTLTQELLTEEDFTRAVSILNTSRRMFLFGIGGSEIIAADGHHKFLRSSMDVFHNADYHVQLMEATRLTENDCALIISHTGQSREIIEITKIIRESKAKIIAITSYPSSKLAKLADVSLISVSSEAEYRTEALASRISQLSIIDSLYIAYQFQNQDRSAQSLSKIRKVISKFNEPQNES